MTVSEAIAIYVKYKQLRGVLFERGDSRLNAFCNFVNDKEISCITSSEVHRFLGSPKPTASWRYKHMMLHGFFQFWTLRGGMPPIAMPLLPQAKESSFVPHVYSKDEVRALVRATSKISARHPMSVDPRTLRVLVLTLYATGAFLGQVLRLEWKDVDLDEGFITFHERKYQRERTLPIAKGLLQVLRVHARRQAKRSQQFFFSTLRGAQITSYSMNVRFRRIRKLAGLHRPSGGSGRPRLHDFRPTFAVHRINDWLRKGLDLNRMLPALSAYMGCTGLMRSERYLGLAPERFRNELDKLSPAKRKKHWRNDAALMSFLDAL